jgi:lipopolysaccharide/colanic/teichoic acid biosynthesis glycosyltransferase
MTFQKRLMDIFLSVTLLIVLAPLLALIALVILIRDGAPVFYLSKRMRLIDEDFWLIKFRTMKTAVADSGVSGGDKTSRITRTGALLRKTRLDELPQLINVLNGDISFVGPRPPLRQYVERFPDIYKEVLRSRPGITGLASLHFHHHEEWLLHACKDPIETDAVYARACVPRKARLDLIYQRHQGICFDLLLMARTAFKVLR